MPCVRVLSCVRNPVETMSNHTQPAASDAHRSVRPATRDMSAVLRLARAANARGAASLLACAACPPALADPASARFFAHLSRVTTTATASEARAAAKVAASRHQRAALHASADARDSASEHPPAPSPKNTKDSYMLFHPQYDMDAIADITPAHRPPRGLRDWVSFSAVQAARSGFDRITGYAPSKVLTREEWLTRFIFLETVAGVPGMVGAMLRHMVSLRTLKRDHGWIHTLLEEAENERMHLLTFMCLKQPGFGFRLAVLGAQGVFFNAFLAAYILTPRTCHRFVGYLEEEAVKTYTHALRDIGTGGSDASVWAETPAPTIAIQYWRLPPDATVRDVVTAVRADEASHSHVNHTLGIMAKDQENPFQTGHTTLPKNFVEPPEGFSPFHDPR